MRITRKNDAFVAKIVNTHLTKGFMAIFAPAECLPSPATLLRGQIASRIVIMVDMSLSALENIKWFTQTNQAIIVIFCLLGMISHVSHVLTIIIIFVSFLIQDGCI